VPDTASASAEVTTESAITNLMHLTVACGAGPGPH
jgi:hypothetical protein